MSVSHTTDQVRDRTKTVTRRLGWWEDKNGRRILADGDRLTLCEQVMGLPLVNCPECDGEGHRYDSDYDCDPCNGTGVRRAPSVRLCDVDVVSVRRERLWDITAEDIVREGLTYTPGGPFAEAWWPDETGICGPTVHAWVSWWCETFGGRPDQMVTRIEWRYL